MIIFNYFNLSFLLGGITCSFTAIWVYFKNKHSPLNKSWFLLSLSAGIWSISHFLMSISRSHQLALIFCYILYTAAILIPSFYVYFIFSLVDETYRHRKEIIVSFVISFVFLILMPTKSFLRDVTPKFVFNYYDNLGPLSILFIVFFTAMPLYSLYRLFSAIKGKSKIKALQLKYVFLASIFGFLGGGSTFPLAFNIPFPPYFLILFVFYPIIITYAILKYRLMDIRLTITRTGIFVAVYTLVLGLPFILAISGKEQLMKLLGGNWWSGPLILMALLATVGPFVYIFLQKKAEAVFLREQQRYQQALRKAAEEITRIHKMDKLLNLITNLFINPVKVSGFGIYLFDENTSSFLLKSSHNLKDRHFSSITNNNIIVRWLKQKREIAVYEEIKRKAQEMPESDFETLTKEMKNLGVNVLIPCFFEDELTIIITLGNKLSGKVYTNSDLNAFSILASQIALAIKDASLYESMEEQVRQRTKELVAVREQLIQTEKLATIGTLAGGVAHEINNPLAAILINAQMLLASEKIQDEDDKESLEIIEDSTKRCQAIVQKLMFYARKPSKDDKASSTDLAAVIKKTLLLLGYQLKQENIEIAVNMDSNEYLIPANSNELEQVLTNMILNAKDAIKKVKNSGKIYINIYKKNKRVFLEIKDNGTGIDKRVLSKIFDPFFTTKDVGKGLGLGLSICQSIVKRYKGEISARSEVGKGTVFTIEFPFLDADCRG